MYEARKYKWYRVTFGDAVWKILTYVYMHVLTYIQRDNVAVVNVRVQYIQACMSVCIDIS